MDYESVPSNINRGCKAELRPNSSGVSIRSRSSSQGQEEQEKKSLVICDLTFENCHLRRFGSSFLTGFGFVQTETKDPGFLNDK